MKYLFSLLALLGLTLSCGKKSILTHVKDIKVENMTKSRISFGKYSAGHFEDVFYTLKNGSYNAKFYGLSTEEKTANLILESNESKEKMDIFIEGLKVDKGPRRDGLESFSGYLREGKLDGKEASLYIEAVPYIYREKGMDYLRSSEENCVEDTQCLAKAPKRSNKHGRKLIALEQSLLNKLFKQDTLNANNRFKKAQALYKDDLSEWNKEVASYKKRLGHYDSVILPRHQKRFERWSARNSRANIKYKNELEIYNSDLSNYQAQVRNRDNIKNRNKVKKENFRREKRNYQDALQAYKERKKAHKHSMALYEKKLKTFKRLSPIFEKEEAIYNERLQEYKGKERVWRKEHDLYTEKRRRYTNQLSKYKRNKRNHAARLQQYNIDVSNYEQDLKTYKDKQKQYKRDLEIFEAHDRVYQNSMNQYNGKKSQFDKEYASYQRKKASFETRKRAYRKYQQDYTRYERTKNNFSKSPKQVDCFLKQDQWDRDHLRYAKIHPGGMRGYKKEYSPPARPVCQRRSAILPPSRVVDPGFFRDYEPVFRYKRPKRKVARPVAPSMNTSRPGAHPGEFTETMPTFSLSRPTLGATRPVLGMRRPERPTRPEFNESRPLFTVSRPFYETVPRVLIDHPVHPIKESIGSAPVRPSSPNFPRSRPSAPILVLPKERDYQANKDALMLVPVNSENCPGIRTYMSLHRVYRSSYRIHILKDKEPVVHILSTSGEFSERPSRKVGSESYCKAIAPVTGGEMKKIRSMSPIKDSGSTQFVRDDKNIKAILKSSVHQDYRVNYKDLYPSL